MSLETCFKGKTILVTGAARGIGKGLVARLHEYGANIYALSRNPDNLKQLEKEFPGIKTLAVNLENWDETRAVVQSISEPVEFLINNAAVVSQESFLDIKPESFDKVFDTNLKAVLNVSQVVAKQMIKNGIAGSIVNISSHAGIRPFPAMGSYCASKAALDMLTKTMALELGSYKIRVNAINIASVDTDMLKSVDPQAWRVKSGISAEEAMKAFVARIPLGEPVIELDQVVNVILFTASNLVRMMTGHGLVVNGGYSLT